MGGYPQAPPHSFLLGKQPHYGNTYHNKSKLKEAPHIEHPISYPLDGGKSSVACNGQSPHKP